MVYSMILSPFTANLHLLFLPRPENNCTKGYQALISIIMTWFRNLPLKA